MSRSVGDEAWRSTTIGSTRVARQAGTRQAARPTASRCDPSDTSARLYIALRASSRPHGRRPRVLTPRPRRSEARQRRAADPWPSSMATTITGYDIGRRDRAADPTARCGSPSPPSTRRSIGMEASRLDSRPLDRTRRAAAAALPTASRRPDGRSSRCSVVTGPRFVAALHRVAGVRLA